MTPEEFKKWRQSLGVTQAVLAQYIGYDVGAISRWERGVSCVPELLTIVAQLITKQHIEAANGKTRKARRNSKNVQKREAV